MGTGTGFVIIHCLLFVISPAQKGDMLGNEGKHFMYRGQQIVLKMYLGPTRFQLGAPFPLGKALVMVMVGNGQ